MFLQRKSFKVEGMNRELKNIVLIHGLWTTPRSWDLFRGFYTDRGFRVFTPAWPGIQGEVEDVRRDPSGLAGVGVAEIANHYDQFARSLDEPPILMGHAFGGLIVQMLLDRGLGAAGVAIDSVAPKGVLRLPLSAIRSARAVLSNPANVKRTVALTFEQFRYVFANNMSEGEARSAYERYAIPGPGRPLFQAALANLNPNASTRVNYRNNSRAPLLLIAGSEDHPVPSSLNRSNFKMYRGSAAITAYKEFPNRSHLIIAQEGWREVAEYALCWSLNTTAAVRWRRMQGSDSLYGMRQSA
jgi:pimeloyl-ACP methyl ester carboxylesterase